MGKVAGRTGAGVAWLGAIAVLGLCMGVGWQIAGAPGLGIGLAMGALGAGTAFGSVLSAREKVRRAHGDTPR